MAEIAFDAAAALKRNAGAKPESLQELEDTRQEFRARVEEHLRSLPDFDPVEEVRRIRQPDAPLGEIEPSSEDPFGEEETAALRTAFVTLDREGLQRASESARVALERDAGAMRRQALATERLMRKVDEAERQFRRSAEAEISATHAAEREARESR
jgi:hypothetical protein